MTLKQARQLSYQENLVAGYLAKYEKLTKQMVNDYKIYAINAYLTERYCGQEKEQKYSSQKHKKLIEKALFGGHNWHRLREVLNEVTEGKFHKIESASLPFSVKNVARDLHEDFKKYLEISDLDELLQKNLKIMFMAEQSKIEIFDLEYEQKKAEENKQGNKSPSKEVKNNLNHESGLELNKNLTNSEEDLEKLIANVERASPELIRTTIALSRQNSIDKQRYKRAMLNDENQEKMRKSIAENLHDLFNERLERERDQLTGVTISKAS